MLRMTMRGALAAALLAMPGGCSGAKQTHLVIGGEAYDGPPKFEVLFDGQKIGEGTVSAAIDTATRRAALPTAMVKAPYIESFAFDIPDDSLQRRRRGPRPLPQRGLWRRWLEPRPQPLSSRRLRSTGCEVPATAMTTLSAAGLEPSAILGEFLVIFDGTADGVAAAPDMGWPDAR